jgi:hypothetical protein
MSPKPVKTRAGDVGLSSLSHRRDMRVDARCVIFSAEKPNAPAGFAAP